MKTLGKWPLLVGITVLACHVWASPAVKQEDDEVQKIVVLSKESRKANVECESFLSNLRAKTLNSEKTEYYVSRSSAHEALTTVANYPGTPLATSEALDRFLNFIDLPSGIQGADLWTAMNGLSDCHSVEFLGVLTRLMAAKTRALLPADEASQVQRVIVNYLKRETRGGPRFLHQTTSLIKLTVHAQKEKILVFPTSVQDALANLEWKVSKLDAAQGEHRSALEQASATVDSEASTQLGLTELLDQLDESEDLRDDLVAILKKESSRDRHAPELEFGPILMMK